MNGVFKEALSVGRVLGLGLASLLLCGSMLPRPAHARRVACGSAALPLGVVQEPQWTARLRERFRSHSDVQTFAVYTSDMTLEQFSAHYRGRRFVVTEALLPVASITKVSAKANPLLRKASKSYRDEMVRQVIIFKQRSRGSPRHTGLSAADRYVDPDTFALVNRLFIVCAPVKTE